MYSSNSSYTTQRLALKSARSKFKDSVCDDTVTLRGAAVNVRTIARLSCFS